MISEKPSAAVDACIGWSTEQQLPSYGSVLEASPLENCDHSFTFLQFPDNVSSFHSDTSRTLTEPPFATKATRNVSLATVISLPILQSSKTVLVTRSSSLSSSASTSSSSPSPSSSPSNTASSPNYFFKPDFCNQSLANESYQEERFSNPQFQYPTITDNQRQIPSQSIGELTDLHSVPAFNIHTDLNNSRAINSCGCTTQTFPDDNNNNNEIDCISPSVSQVQCGSLPSISSLVCKSSLGEKGLLHETCTMRHHDSMYDNSDITDDGGVGIGNRCESIDEEEFINLTNVGEIPDQGQPSITDHPDIYSMDSLWAVSPADIDLNLKAETCENDDLIGRWFPMETGYELSPTDDSDDYESPSPDSVSFSQAFFTGNMTDYTGHFPMQRHYIDNQYLHSFSEEGSSQSDESEGYGELSDQILPNFKELHESQTSSDMKSQRRRGTTSCHREKKRAQQSQILVGKERRKPGRKPGQVSNVLHLWEFLRDLLQNSEYHGIIEWISKAEGIFRVMNSTEVARLWGEKKKNKKMMTYEKMSRSLRYSRLEGYFAEIPKDKKYPKKLCFKFGPKSKIGA